MIFLYRNIFHISPIRLKALNTKNPDAHEEQIGSASKVTGGFYVKLKDLIGQSFSAFSASSLQYVSTVSGSHSLSEAVFLFSLTLFGLIGSEHLLAPP